MTQQIINVGTGPDSYTGDTLRTAFEKTNSNFDELYAMSGISSNANLTLHSLTTTGNVTATYFVGNGALLTGITAGGSNYSNSNVASYLPTYSGNISAAYYFGDGSNLTGINATANLGNLYIDGPENQTIVGTVANAAVGFRPYPGSRVLFTLQNDSSGINSNLSFQSLSTNSVSMFTSGNTSISIGTGTGFMAIDAATGHMGFNTTNTGYNFNFRGEIAANAYYARADFPVGYSFTTPLGLTGMNHVYQNDVNGNVSLVRITHDNATPAKFYENNTTILSGNLIVTADNAVGTFPNAFIQTYSNINSYSQMVLQNINSGDQASFDIILTADNGNDSQMFADFGIASSTYNFPGYGAIKPNDVYLLAVGDNITGPGSAGGPDLLVGSTTGNINLFIGAPEDANVVATISNTGMTLSSNTSLQFGDLTIQTTAWLGNVDAVNAHINFSSSAVGHNPGNGTITFADGSLQNTAWNGLYTPNVSADWSMPAPTTINEALDRLAAVVKVLNGGTGA